MEDALAIEIRRRIYNLLLSSPGIYFRETQRQLGVPTGVLEYHLNYLLERELITQAKDRRHTRYFVKGTLSPKEKECMKALRNDNDRTVLMHLLVEPFSGYDAIMEKRAMSRTSVAESLRRLVASGLVEAGRDERIKIYSVADPGEVAKLLIAYRESFIDETVDRFILLWESMR